MSGGRRLWDEWFDEHPDGSLGFVFEDGSRSAMFRSAGEVDAFLDDYAGAPPERTVRTRGDSSEDEIDHRDELRAAEEGER
ncbi:MAG: hypothetical protein ACRDLP_04505 [Solirubrobacteraceae bacterium]